MTLLIKIKKQISGIVDKIILSDKIDSFFESKIIFIASVVASGFVAGYLLPEIRFDDGSIMHTKEIFMLAPTFFLIGWLYGQRRNRHV